MERILADLLAALRERLTIIADKESRRDPARHTERLKAVSEGVEQLEQQLPPAIDPPLRHFLQRRSYSKALELLNAGSSSKVEFLNAPLFGNSHLHCTRYGIQLR